MTVTTPKPTPGRPATPPTPEQLASARALLAAGRSQEGVARVLRLNRNTMMKYLRAGAA